MPLAHTLQTGAPMTRASILILLLASACSGVESHHLSLTDLLNGTTPTDDTDENRAVPGEGVLDAGVGDAQASQTNSNSVPNCEARATTRVSIVGNLDAQSIAPPNAWGLSQPYSLQSAANFSTTIVVYGQQGDAATVDTYFAMSDPTVWNYHVVRGDRGSPIEVGSGKLYFTLDGALTHHEVLVPFRLPRTDSSWGPAIELNLGSPLDTGGSGLDGLTSFPLACTVSAQSQDGNPAECDAGSK